jgi:hypothetical protein
MIAVHFENLLFLLFIGIAFFFQLLTRAATKSNKDSTKPHSNEEPQPQAPSAPRSSVAETDQERIRKFLEALGQPAGSAPPPPVKPKPFPKPVTLPHVGPGPSPLPPLKTRPPDLAREVQRSQPAPPPSERRIFVPKGPLPVFEVHQTTAPVEHVATPAAAAPSSMSLDPRAGIARKDRSDVLSLLNSSTGLREAIVLREIFGPPRSMQPLDLIGLG